MIRISEQPAYILHRYEYGETSLVLECLTRDHGRLGLLAKGARCRRLGSRLYEPFVPALVGWTGQGALPLLADVEPLPTPEPLTGRALWCGFYLNELLLGLLHRHDAYPDLFQAYREVLGALLTHERQEEALRLFELRLLQELGYGLSLELEAEGQTRVEPGRWYTYVLDVGPVVARDRGGEGIPVLGQTLLALARRQFPDDQTRRQARVLLRAALNRHLSTPLQTPSVFRQMQQARTGAIL